MGIHSEVTLTVPTKGWLPMSVFESLTKTELLFSVVLTVGNPELVIRGQPRSYPPPSTNIPPVLTTTLQNVTTYKVHRTSVRAKD